MSEENSINTPKNSICPRCGAEFTCSTHTGSCWCMEFKLSAENLKLLKEKYTTCLCPKCLKAFSEKVGLDTCSF